jgi:aspartate racemase
MDTNRAGKLAGILGGMGPGATIDLCREIMRLTPAQKDQDHLRVLAYSNAAIPDRTSAILSDGEDPLPELIRSARLLEQAGAELIAIPCNTAHYYYEPIRDSVGIPVINMLDETCEEFLRAVPGGRCAGLLAASGTARTGIYERAFRKRGVSMVIPDAELQAAVHASILDVKAGRHGSETRGFFHAAGLRLIERGAEAVILGCTEIPLAFDVDAVPYRCINSTEVLARAVLRLAGRSPR